VLVAMAFQVAVAVYADQLVQLQQVALAVQV
jgi:hypothetical protein